MFLFLWAVAFLISILQLFFLKKILLCGPVKSPGAARSIPGFDKLFQVSRFQFLLTVLLAASFETICELENISCAFQSAFFWCIKSITLLKVRAKHGRIGKYWIEYHGIRHGNYFHTKLLQLIQQEQFRKVSHAIPSNVVFKDFTKILSCIFLYY